MALVTDGDQQSPATPLDYSEPEKKPRRPFLAQPVWRNWVIAYVLIGGGFGISAPRGFPWLGYAMMILGIGIVLAALSHAFWKVVMRS